MRCLNRQAAGVRPLGQHAAAVLVSRPSRCMPCTTQQQQRLPSFWIAEFQETLPRQGHAGAGAAAAGRHGSSCRCSSTGPNIEPVTPLVVVEGDIVTFHMKCTAEDGQVMENSRDADEPLSFEIGAGEITGNPLFQAFDGALRGLAVNDYIELEISGGDWKQELLFTVPRDHPEVERLEGRYKNLGGLAKDLAVELANGSMAVVVEATPEYVKLDANNLMSGKKLVFELEVLSIERPDS